MDVLKGLLPVAEEECFFLPKGASERNIGLVLVDMCNGFCTVGAGNMAPVEPNIQISTMIDEAISISKVFCDRNWPIFAFLDSHFPDKHEPPYPPHCIIGSGEENFVPVYGWYYLRTCHGWRRNRM